MPGGSADEMALWQCRHTQFDDSADEMVLWQGVCWFPVTVNENGFMLVQMEMVSCQCR